MKTIKVFLGLIFLTSVSISCNKEKNSTDNENISVANFDSLQKAQESIKKIEEFEFQQYKQDSIDDLQIKGYSIKKISGKHKYGGVTKIEYKSLSQILSDLEKRAEKEMWTNEYKQEIINEYKRISKGGEIRLDIERITIGSANTEYFTIIIKDLDEKELYRINLESDIPEAPINNNYWWNISINGIEKRIKPPFYVYVVDELEDGPFKFEVSPIKK